MKDISLYIHIPFCTSKCYYCDFTSFSNMRDKIAPYIDSLIIELSLYIEKLRAYNIKTVFIGGGTPSSIDANHIYRIMNYIYDNFNADNIEEITIESNPESLDREKINIYKKSGIDRLSMGVQTLDDDLIKSIGRGHRASHVYESFRLLREADFKNINVDLIFGLPDQKIGHVIDSLKKIIKLGAEHISYYSLILEDGTYLNKLYKQGRLDLPPEDEEREMYSRINEYLKERGYSHYEISNYGLPGYESKHNLVYWDVQAYLGLGLSSHSNLEGKRFWNTSNMDYYIKKLSGNNLAIDGEEVISRDMEIFEYCILGLRKISGINKLDFKNRFGVEIESLYGEIIGKHERNKLILNNSESIRLTNKGLDLSNQVEVDFLP